MLKDLAIKDKIKAMKNRYKQYDLVITVDIAKRDLIATELKAAIFDTARKTVSIDHHPISGRESEAEHAFADINLRDPSAVSASQLIMQFAKLLGLKRISSKISDAILAGIMSDIGPHTHDHSSLILPSDINLLGKTPNYKRVLRELAKKDPEEDRLATNLLENNLRLSDDGKIAYFIIDKAEGTKVTKEVLDMALNSIRDKGVELYFCIVHNSEDPVSLTTAYIRSEGNNNSLEQLMKALGGVGHNYACLLTEKGTDAEIMALSIKKALAGILNPKPSK